MSSSIVIDGGWLHIQHEGSLCKEKNGKSLSLPVSALVSATTFGGFPYVVLLHLDGVVHPPYDLENDFYALEVKKRDAAGVMAQLTAAMAMHRGEPVPVGWQPEPQNEAAIETIRNTGCAIASTRGGLAGAEAPVA